MYGRVFTYGLKNQMPIITCAQIKGQKKNDCASVNTLYLYPVYISHRGPLTGVSSLSAFSIYGWDSKVKLILYGKRNIIPNSIMPESC